MTLNVEVVGIGVCRNPSYPSQPYSIFIISVQQDNLPEWSVYRRYQSFNALHDHLRNILYSTGINVPLLPIIDPNNMQPQYLENVVEAMNSWLVSAAAETAILRTQYMYQFLCMDGNLLPPYFEVFWHKGMMRQTDESRSNNYDVMDDMDGVFDRPSFTELLMDDTPHQNTITNNRGYVDGVASTGNYDARGAWNNTSPHSGLPPIGKPQNQQLYYNNTNHSNMAGSKRGYEGNDDEKDDINIQSLSVVEAEFVYDKSIDGKNAFDFDTGEGSTQTSPMTSPNASPRRTIAKSQDNALSQPTSAAVVAQPPKPPKRKINLDSFHIIKVIGKGSFGKVFLVREKSSNTVYALKVLKKEHLLKKNQIEHTKTERSVLGYINHPFIVGLNMAFQTRDKLFFVLDYCSGGELFFHLGKVGKFSEERAKFYASQIILALEYVHNLDIVYRDLKPENVLLDAKGNVRLTDFGLSKEGVTNPSSGAFSFCGTPEYIAPEVLQRQGYGRAVDWWSLGSLTYEMISGLPPFYSTNRAKMFEMILGAEVKFPPAMSDFAKDVLSKLLIRDPKLRLGSGERDAIEVKEHPFFAEIDWEGLLNGRIPAPWAPAVVGSLDTSQFDQEFTAMNPTVSPDVRGAYFGVTDKDFEGFSFVDDSAANLMNQNMGMAASSYKSSSGFSMLSSTINNKKFS